MKQLLALGLLCISFGPAAAQEYNCSLPAPFSDTARHMLAPLDKSQVPTGVLYEAVFPWADLEYFDGSAAADTSSFPHFVQAYSELYHATLNNAALLHPNDYEANYLSLHPDRDFHHALGIIDYDFNTIDSQALVKNQLYVANHQLHDVPGRSSSPYLGQHVFLASPLLAGSPDRFYSGTHYFHIEPRFILSNTGLRVQDIEYIDFEVDGSLLHRQYVQGQASLVAAVYFPPFVDKIKNLIIKIKKILGNGQVSRIELSTEVWQDLTPCKGQTQIFVQGEAFDGGYGQGAYASKGRGYVFFGQGHCADKKLRKPVIFLDGFDPTNTRNVWQIWDDRINKEFPDVDGSNVKLGEELISKGYDVVIYDYDEQFTLQTPNAGGANFIENNGIAFANFLEELYRQHGSSLEQDFIVIGPSMGALVARYGLTWLEHQNRPHHTALYISFDGPHQGSQVPLGMQSMLDLVTQYGELRLASGIKNFLHQSNAAKQMLVHHSSTNSETVAAHPYRQRFLSNLAAIGNFPTQCRTVAIVNGNRLGTLKKTHPEVPIQPCGPEFEFAVRRRLNPNCSKDWCHKLRIQVYAQTEGPRCKSMDFSVKRGANLLRLIFGNGEFLRKTTYTRPSFTNNSYDIAPGGVFGKDSELNISKGKFWQWVFLGNLRIPVNKLSNTNFVPTTSSLDYAFPQNESRKLYKDFAGVELSRCAGTIPFDQGYAPDDDLGHAQYNAQIAYWFRGEVYNLKPKASCTGCPDYVAKGLPVTANDTEIRAKRSIKLEPNFSVGRGMVFSAEIGCGNSTSLVDESGKETNPGHNLLSTCPFEWDVNKNKVACNPYGGTNFQVFVKNLPTDTYTEFAFGGVNGSPGIWHRANIGDRGWQVTVPYSGTGAQKFFARPKGQPDKTIHGWLQYCQ